MNHQSSFTAKQSSSTVEVQQTYSTTLSSFRDIFSDELKGKSLLAGDCSSARPILHVQTESLNSPSPQQASPFRSQKSNTNPEADSSLSHTSHLQYPKNMFSQSSTFCTSLYSSSRSTETHQQLHNLPFLPHPPKCDQTVPVHSSKSHLSLSEDSSSQFADESSSKSPLVLSREPSNQFTEESSGHLTDFLNFPEDASDGSFHEATFGSNRLTFTEQLELQFLSEELDIAITDNSSNPRMDEIYEASQVYSAPTSVSNSKQNNALPPVPPVNNQTPSCYPSPGTTASHKPRMRWTPELHEAFLESVKKLDGADNATPKGILKLMNIEGLTIYHVKSHLQKYRLAKYMPETKEDEKSSCSDEKEKKAASNNNEGDGHSKRGMQVTEALRMQMEVQKQLHEQLEVQRALQLRIEEHARYLHKIVEEQEKACNSFASASRKSLLAETETDRELGQLSTPAPSLSQQADSKTDSSSSTPSKHKGIECPEVEQLVGQKRPRQEAKPEPEPEPEMSKD